MRILPLALILSACGADVAHPSSASFWYSYGGRNREVLEDMLGRFNRLQSRSRGELTIRGTFQGDYFDALAKLRASLLARRAPTLTHVIAEALPELEASGVLEDLGPFARGTLAEDDLIEALTQKGTFDTGARSVPLVAIPFNRSTPILFYNEHLLRRAGQEPPATWLKFASVARALTVRQGNRTVRHGVTCPLSWWFWYAALSQAAGRLLDDDGRHAAFGTGAGVAAVRLFHDMAREGTMRLPPGRDYSAWETAHADFLAERAAMLITSTAFVAYLSDNAPFTVAASRLPGSRRRAVPTGGTFFVMLRSAPEPEKRAAWSFMMWMIEPEQTAEWARRTGYLPVSRSAVDSPSMRQLYREQPAFRVALDQLDDAVTFPWTRALLAIEREAVQPALERVVAGIESPEAAMAGAARIADERLREARGP